MLPTFFVIGAGKAGTTSLHRYLGLHPQVHVSPVKETNFFCRPEDGPWRFGRVDNRDDYEALFESTAPARGECSPNYSHHPLRPGVPERIREVVPSGRFVYLVRDPIERIRARYLQATTSVWGERRPFRKALGDLGAPLENHYVVPSLYATQVERYLEVFPPERLLVVDSALLQQERRATLRRIFDFLGVDDFDDPGFAEELNVGEAKRVYTRRYARVRESRLGGAWRRLPEGLRVPLGSRAMRALTSPARAPALEPDVRARLEEIFRPEVARLRKLTGQSFESWSL